MSATFTGYSVLQAGQISTVSTDLTALQTTVSSHTTSIANLVATDATHTADIAANELALTQHVAAYNSKMTALDANDSAHAADLAAHATQISNLETNLTNHVNAYDAKVEALDEKDAEHDTAIAALESALQAAVTSVTESIDGLDADNAAQNALINGLRSDVDTHTAQITGINANAATQGGLLTGLRTDVDAVTGRVTSLETDISTRVQNEINDKVATATFDALATELRNADSALTQALATKVATTVQQQTDEAQNALINSKVAQEDFDATVTVVGGQIEVVDNRILAMEEFVRVLLATYPISKTINGVTSAYDYTGALQALPVTPEPFTFLNKATSGSNIVFTLQFTDYGLNAFKGELLALDASLATLATYTSADVNGTKKLTVTVPSSAAKPLRFRMTSLSGADVFNKIMTATDIDSVPNFVPLYPVTLFYDDGTLKTAPKTDPVVYFKVYSFVTNETYDHANGQTFAFPVNVAPTPNLTQTTSYWYDWMLVDPVTGAQVSARVTNGVIIQ